MVTKQQRVEAIARFLFDQSGQERLVGDWDMMDATCHVKNSYLDEALTIVEADPLSKEVGHI